MYVTAPGSIRFHALCIKKERKKKRKSISMLKVCGSGQVNSYRHLEGL
jgi:hypothetical protein